MSIAPQKISLAISAGLILATTPLAASEWYADPALQGWASSKRVVSFRHWNTRFNVSIKNDTDFASKGPHRAIIKTWRTVANADGYTADGYPYINVCGETCTLGGKQQRTLEVAYRISFWDFFFFLRPRVSIENQPYELQLLHNADMDGTAGALQNVSNFSAILNKLRSEYPQNTLVLSSGDNYIPGPRYSASSAKELHGLLGVAGNGRADISFMNAMGYQATAVGNHDLDGGTKEFASIINSSTQIIDEETGKTGTYSGADFPYLSSNLNFSTDDNLAPLIKTDNQAPSEMKNGLAKSTIIDVDGQKIGVVGASTPKLDQITNTGGITIAPSDGDDIPGLAAEIQATVDVLRNQGINKIILLAHMQQIQIEKQLAGLLKGVDIIVAGGSNTLLADGNDHLLVGDTAADNYPLSLVSADGEPVMVVNTDGDYKYLGRLLSQFDINGRIITDRLDDGINGAYATDETGIKIVDGPAPIPAVKELADAVSKVLAARDGTILGQTQVYLDGRRGSVRTQETNLGNLTADANLWVAQQTDASVRVSLKNGGGIRDDIGYFTYPPGSTNPDDLQFFPTAANKAAGKKSGDISQFDIQGSLSFNNGLTLITVNAAQLQELMEHAVAEVAPGAAAGRFPQISGMRFSYDPSKAPGSRVQSLALVENGNITDVIVKNGSLEGDPARTIRMVTLGFLAGGGDGYPFPGEGDRVNLKQKNVRDGAATFADTGTEQDALAEYLLANHQSNSNTAFNKAETPMSQDERIQNLSIRNDTVLNP